MNRPNNMKHELQLLDLALSNAENELKVLLSKVRDSRKTLEHVDTLLALHSEDDLSVAIMQAQFAAALPREVPGVEVIGRQTGRLVGELMAERERMS